jgi:2-(1,2-epoxy-1,2-dihydrophenyl)acetyl-CoA isomerase
MAEAEVLYAVEDDVATITLNAPDRLNALSEAMLRGLAAAAAQAQDDSAVRVVVLTGAGRAFCAGGDVKAMAQAADEGPDRRRETVALVQQAQLALRRIAKPMVAAVNGPAYGAGLDIAFTRGVWVQKARR